MKYLAATLLILITLQTAAVVWIAVSWEVARRQSIALMEETRNQFSSSEIIREVPVTVVEPRPLPDMGEEEEIVTSKVTKIVPNPGSGDPEFITDLEGTGPDSVVRDLAPGVYTATISGDTIDLDVRMSSADGRSRFGWGHTEAVSFSVGDHSGAELYPGRTRITVTPARRRCALAHPHRTAGSRERRGVHGRGCRRRGGDRQPVAGPLASGPLVDIR